MDRTRVLTVILEQELKDEDLESIINTLKSIRLVQDVLPGKYDGFNQILARNDFIRKVLPLIDDLVLAECYGRNSFGKQVEEWAKNK